MDEQKQPGVIPTTFTQLYNEGYELGKKHAAEGRWHLPFGKHVIWITGYKDAQQGKEPARG